MDSIEYLDFELRIEKRGQRYLATVVHSPSGEASSLFKLPFSNLEIENFVLRMESTHRGMRRISTPEMQTVRQFGNKLFEAVFCDEVRSCFMSSQNEAKNRGLGLRLKLRLDAPELINIPWEFLYDGSLGRFLGLFENTPIVRYIEVHERVQPLIIKPPLSVLVMVSSPSDYPFLDVEREKANLQDALGDLIHAGLITLTWVEEATLPALAEKLLRKRYHIFHYIGHGGFNEQSKDGVLVLEDDQGRGQWVSGERLAYLLGNQPTLRLVILNSCEGGRTAKDDPFAGIATTLVRTGSVPAVVAMQLAISDVAAISFGRGFFNALSVGKSVDAAVTQARLAIFASGNDVEWGTPVLYMRSPDGRIFDVQAQSPSELEALLSAAETAREEARQAEKVRAEALLLQQQEAARIKALEERQAKLKSLYDAARSRLAAKDWMEAIKLLKNTQELQPDYLDVADLLEQAQEGLDQEKREAEKAQAEALLFQQQEAARIKALEERQTKLKSLYEGAQSRLAEKDWVGAGEILVNLQDLQSDYLDVADLIIRVQEEQEQEKREAEKAQAEALLLQQQEAARIKALEDRQVQLKNLYDHAQVRLIEKDWGEAIKLLESIREIQSDYLDVIDLFKQAQEGQALEKRQAEEDQKRKEEETRMRQAEEARQTELGKLYAEADEAVKAGNWSKAIQSFEDVLKVDPGYRDALKRHGLARSSLAQEEAVKQRQALLAQNYKRAMDHFQARRWQEAILAFQAVIQIDPNYSDPVYGSASARLARAKQEKELVDMPVPKDRSAKPTTIPEEILSHSKPTIPPTGFPPRAKPTTLPEDVQRRGKPKDLPK